MLQSPDGVETRMRDTVTPTLVCRAGEAKDQKWLEFDVSNDITVTLCCTCPPHRQNRLTSTTQAAIAEGNTRSDIDNKRLLELKLTPPRFAVLN